MNTNRIQKAEQLIAEGEKHLKTSLFKWTPDTDSAIECFDKGNKNRVLQHMGVFISLF